MSSRYGPRATGTDGSDFRHRQRVALHYRESVTNKFRLKCALIVHGGLIVVMLVKLLEDILDRFQIDWGPLERLKVPVPYFWEYWWIVSVFPLIAALTSLPRNNERRLRYCYYAFFLFGLIPIAIGAGTKLPELLAYLGYGRGGENDEEDDDRHPIDGASTTPERFLGFPMAVVWYMFFAVAFQVHAFTMYFVTHLIKAWQPATVRSTTTTAAVQSSSSSMANSSSNQSMAARSISQEKLSQNAAGNGSPNSWKNDKKVK